MSRKCYCATSVKAVRAVEIRTARHPESINDNKRVKAKGGFFLEICQANGSDQRVVRSILLKQDPEFRSHEFRF